MPIEQTAHRPAPFHLGARLVLVCLLTLTAVGAPAAARAQGDPPPPHPARGPEDDPQWLTPKDGDGASAAPGVLEGEQSAAGRLAVQSFRDGNWEIYFGSDNAYAVHSRLTADPAADIEPRLSPDATRIVFTSKRSGNYDLWLINVDGSGLRQLTNDPATDSAPAWSPDGTQIAFASSRGGNSDVYVMKADGSAVSRLTTNADYDGEPAWSPDGTLIAFISRRSAGAADYFLYTMTAQGGDPLLRSATPYASRPNWSPDGTRILFDGANASGWQRLFLATLSNGVVQETATSGFYKANYEVWAGSWGFGAQAYATLVSYVQYQGTWYVESMSILSIDTPSGAAGGISPQTRDAMPDWRNADRLPPQSLIYPHHPFVLALPGAGIAFTGQVVDQGIAGIDRIETQYRLTGGEWQALSQTCSIYDASFNCMVMPPLRNMQIRARGVDRMGNAEAWPESPGKWIGVSLYRLRVDGLVTDLRGLPLTGVPLKGAPSIEPGPTTGTDGRYRLYVPDLPAPIVFTLTATLNGAAGVPRPYALDALAFGTTDAAAVENFALRPVDQTLPDPGFDAPGGVWPGAGGLPPQWSPATTWPVEPTRMRVGWEDGLRVLASSDRPPMAVAADGMTLIVRHDATLGMVFERCVMDQPCDPVEAIGGDDVLALGAAGDGAAAVLLRLGAEAVVRTRTPAGVWSAPQSLLAGDGTAHHLIAGPDGDWHAVWNGPTGLVVLSHRNTDGTWTAPSNIGGLTHPRYSTKPVFDLQGRLHVPMCSTDGLLDMTWSAVDGLQGPIALAPYHCYDNVGLRASMVDDAGNLYVASSEGDAVRINRLSPGGVVTEFFGVGATEFRTADVVSGEGGRPALVLVDYTSAHYRSLLIGQLTPTDEWALTRLGVFEPDFPLTYQYLAWNQAAQRLLLRRAAYPGYALTVSIAELSLGLSEVAANAVRQVALAPGLHRPMLGLAYRHTDPTAALTIRVQNVGGVPGPVSQTLPAGAGWQRGWVDLSAFAGQTITMTLNLQGPVGTWPVVDFDEIVLGSWTTPLVTHLAPVQFDTAAGTLTVTGDNFMGTPTVTIGGVVAAVSVIDAQHLSVTVPPALGVGRYPLVVANPDGFATAAAQSVQIGRGLVNLPSLLHLIPGGWMTNYP